jgi:nitroreductase
VIRGGETPDGRDREEYVREVLDIPNEYRVVNIIAIGYPDKQQPLHSGDEYNESKVHEEVYS